MGITVVVMEKFDPEQCLDAIQRHRVTHGQFVPAMFVRMLKLPESVRDSYDVSSLKRVVHAAAPCPVDIKKQMLDWWGPIVDEYYSSSEGAGITFISADDWVKHPGSVGKPLLGVAHILDENGDERTRGPGRPDLLRHGRSRFRLPQRSRQDRRVPRPARLGDRRRRRISQRGRLPVPDRPQAPHDHLGRGEHLPAGGREPARHPPKGVGRRGVRHSGRRHGAKRQGRRADRSTPPTPPTSSPTSCRRGCETGWRTTSVRGRSRSRHSCRARTPASCTSRS